jgi:transcriptional regulator with XRE-family HTH domain
MSTPDDKALGKYIRRVRKHRKLKAVDLARALGKSPSFVCDLEKGRRGLRLSPHIAVQISEYLNVPLKDITSRSFHLSPVTNTDKLNEIYRAMRHKGRAKRIIIALDAMKKEVSELKEDAQPGRLPPRVQDSIFRLAEVFADLQNALTVG